MTTWAPLRVCARGSMPAGLGLANCEDMGSCWGTGAPDIRGVRALRLIQKYGTLEEVLASLDRDQYAVPDPYPFVEARRIFTGASAHCFALQGKTG